MAASRFAFFVLSNAADASDAVTLQTSERSDQRETVGRVAEYAGGRTRVITRTGLRRQTLGLTAINVPMSTVTWLDDHAGTLVLGRDHKGRKMYGTYFVLGVVDVKSRPLANVPFVLQRVSYSEAI